MGDIIGQAGAVSADNRQADDGDNCGKFLVDHGIISCKLVVKAIDKAMEDFIKPQPCRQKM